MPRMVSYDSSIYSRALRACSCETREEELSREGPALLDIVFNSVWANILRDHLNRRITYILVTSPQARGILEAMGCARILRFMSSFGPLEQGEKSCG